LNIINHCKVLLATQVTRGKMAEYSCTDPQLASVLALVDDDAVAETICSTFNVTDLGATNAVVKYSLGLTKEVQTGTNVSFLLTSAYLVFVMQAGFAMLCAGCVRSKNTMNILLKNVIDACISGVFFYLVGYGFAFGATDNPNAFIGNADFALYKTDSLTPAPGWHSFMFQWAFSAAAATIVSGAVAERCTFHAYLGYSAFISGFVYPVVVHWVWSSSGWLSAFRTDGDKLLDMGAIDFAGSGVVHMVGGAAAVMGAFFVGPRLGRFGADGKPNPMPGHNATLVVLGTFLLWFGWYGFNPGSQLAVASNAAATIVSRVAVTTTIGGAAGGLTNVFLVYFLTKDFNLIATCNGVLAGLVGITAGCSVVEPWAAIIVGVVAAPVFTFSEIFILKTLKVDDPVSASALHLCCGAWGVFFPGLLAREKYVTEVYGVTGMEGIFYGGNGKILGCAVTEIAVICGWVMALMAIFFFGMKTMGLLRVSPEVEMAGLDVSKHGGSAYYNEDLTPVKGTAVAGDKA